MDIVEDFDQFYNQIIDGNTPDPEEIVGRWKDRSVMASILILRRKLKFLFHTIFSESNPEPITNKVEMYRTIGQFLLGITGGIIEMTGRNGYQILVRLLNYESKDIGKLVALFLAGNQLKTVHATQELKSAFRSSQDTGFRLALAFALLERESLDEIWSMSVPYLSPLSENFSYKQNKENFDGLFSEIRNLTRSEHPFWPERKIEFNVFEYLATKSIIDIILEDIGSNGKISKIKWGDQWISEDDPKGGQYKTT